MVFCVRKYFYKENIANYGKCNCQTRQSVNTMVHYPVTYNMCVRSSYSPTYWLITAGTCWNTFFFKRKLPVLWYRGWRVHGPTGRWRDLGSDLWCVVPLHNQGLAVKCRTILDYLHMQNTHTKRVIKSLDIACGSSEWKTNIHILLNAVYIYYSMVVTTISDVPIYSTYRLHSYRPRLNSNAQNIQCHTIWHHSFTLFAV